MRAGGGRASKVQIHQSNTPCSKTHYYFNHDAYLLCYIHARRIYLCVRGRAQAHACNYHAPPTHEGRA
jgi:hypothetical protein